MIIFLPTIPLILGISLSLTFLFLYSFVFVSHRDRRSLYASIKSSTCYEDHVFPLSSKVVSTYASSMSPDRMNMVGSGMREEKRG